MDGEALALAGPDLAGGRVVKYRQRIKGTGDGGVRRAYRWLAIAVGAIVMAGAVAAAAVSDGTAKADNTVSGPISGLYEIEDIGTEMCLYGDESPLSEDPQPPLPWGLYTASCDDPAAPWYIWKFVANPDPDVLSYQIVQFISGESMDRCVDSNFFDPSLNNTNSQQGAAYFNSCNNGGYQQWEVQVQSFDDISNNDIVIITDVATNKCLDSNFSNPENQEVGAVYTLPCDLNNYGHSTNWYQQWELTPVSENGD
jgi:hypothetical protein